MDYYTAAVVLLAVGVVIIGSLGYITMTGCRSKNMPPGQPGPDFYHHSFYLLLKTIGPPTLPVIGNEHEIPSSGAHFKCYLSPINRPNCI